MAKKQRGNPLIALRLPQWQIDGLKLLAKQEATTVSEILRGYAATYLAEHGLTEHSEAKGA